MKNKILILWKNEINRKIQILLYKYILNLKFVFYF